MRASPGIADAGAARRSRSGRAIARIIHLGSCGLTWTHSAAPAAIATLARRSATSQSM